MPRGNDADAAKEFAGQYGQAGNAEDLIREHRASFSTLLRSTQNKRADEDAKPKIDHAKLCKLVGEDVLDFAVRGEAVSFVFLKAGSLCKDAVELDKALAEAAADVGDDEEEKPKTRRAPAKAS